MTMRAFQIFRAGTHTAVDGRTLSFTPGHLTEIAAGYDRAKHPAKLVLGHPDSDRDSLGEVQAVVAHGDGLYAFAEVSDGLVQAVREGRYKHVSSSIYRPDSDGNPTPGRHALRHVGFLGAFPPAVKQMQPLAFAEAPAARAAEFALPPARYAAKLKSNFERSMQGRAGRMEAPSFPATVARALYVQSGKSESSNVLPGDLRDASGGDHDGDPLRQLPALFFNLDAMQLAVAEVINSIDPWPWPDAQPLEDTFTRLGQIDAEIAQIADELNAINRQASAIGLALPKRVIQVEAKVDHTAWLSEVIASAERSKQRWLASVSKEADQIVLIDGQPKVKHVDPLTGAVSYRAR